MPVFAFFNAGVTIGASAADVFSAVSLGIFAGLLLGKPIGVVWLRVHRGQERSLPAAGRRRLARHDRSRTARGYRLHHVPVHRQSGVCELPSTLDQAKIGVLAASVVAALAGLAFLRRALPQPQAAVARS